MQPPRPRPMLDSPPTLQPSRTAIGPPPKTVTLVWACFQTGPRRYHPRGHLLNSTADLVEMPGGGQLETWSRTIKEHLSVHPGPVFKHARTSVTIFGGSPMEVREGCNVGGESSIGRGRGGCIGEYTSGSRCQRLPTGGDLFHGQAMSHSRREGSFGLKPHRCGLSS